MAVIKKYFIALFLLFLFATAQAQKISQFLVLDKKIALPGVEGRIDHMAADIAGQRLFIAALGNNTVEAVDLKSGKVIQSLSGFAEPQGIVYVPEFDRIFIANGADGTCRILDGHSFKTISLVDIGDDADNVRYDQAAKKVYVGHGNGALAVIDAKTGAKVTDIKLAGHPESFRMETNSPNLYVNIPNASQIAVVNRDKGMVPDIWPLKKIEGNFPMFLDEMDHRIFIGCRSPARLLVYDFAGHIKATIPISRDTDDLFYDGRNKLIYVSCGGGSIEVIRQNDADHYQKAESISTMPGARTSLFIPELKLFCVAVPHRGNQQAEVMIYKTQ
jgi:hypothetical protein